MRFVLILAAFTMGFGAQDVAAGNNGCPPGLAKKSPACVPPGLAKKQFDADRHHDGRYHDHKYDGDRYRRGDILRGDYIVVRDPYRYGLNRDHTYVHVGNYVYRIDRNTREILDLIGAVSAILN